MVEKICRVCRSAFLIFPAQIRKGGGIYCSRACKHKGQTFLIVETATKRFWASVEKTKTCWLWHGNRSNDGYGLFFVTRQHLVRAHRFALQMSLGRPIADGLFACHHCDVPLCVRPTHLYEGTAKTNTQDAIARGLMTPRLTTTENWKKPEYRTKVLSGMANSWASPSRRITHKHKTIELWKDPGYRERTTRAIRLATLKRSPEERARQAEASRKRWQDPAYKARVSDKISLGRRRGAKAISSSPSPTYPPLHN